MTEEPKKPKVPIVLTQVGQDGITDEQIAQIFEELGMEPDPEDDADVPEG